MSTKEVYKNVTFSEHLPLLNNKSNSADNNCLFIDCLFHQTQRKSQIGEVAKNYCIEPSKKLSKTGHLKRLNKKSEMNVEKHRLFYLCTSSKKKQGNRSDLHRS